jgi:hypothetical protein
MELVEREPRKNAARGSRWSVRHRHVHLKGSHWLCIQPGFWRLELAEGLTVRSTSSAKAQDMACARLRGEKLANVAIDPASGRTVFSFDLGGRITVAARSKLDEEYDELWILHAPRHVAVAIHAMGLYRVGSTRAADGMKRPIELATREHGVVSIGRRRPSAV